MLDPFPKPSYLFCVVAGKLGSIKDTYTTASGKEVHLEIFSEEENVNKLDYAMESLKRSMKWVGISLLQPHVFDCSCIMYFSSHHYKFSMGIKMI